MKAMKLVGLIFVMFGVFHFGVSVGSISALNSIYVLIPPNYAPTEHQDSDPLWTIKSETAYGMHNHFMDYRVKAAGLIFIGLACWLVASQLEERKRRPAAHTTK